MSKDYIKVLKWKGQDIRFAKIDGEWLAFVEDLYQAFENRHWPEESPYVRRHLYWLPDEYYGEYALTQKEVVEYFFASRKKEFKKFKRETFDKLIQEESKWEDEKSP